MIKILIIGPFPKPISGVALANKVVKEIFDNSDDFAVKIINTSLPFFEESIGEFSLKKMFFFLSLNLRAYKIFKADVVYITPGQTFFGIVKYTFFILISNFLNKELIIHVHGNYLSVEYSLLKGLKKKLFHFLVSKFKKGIVLSPSLKKNLLPFIEKKNIFVLYNFAEEFLYKKKLNKDFTKLNITYLSNLMEEKGIVYLLDSLKQLENLNIDYSAIIAGNVDASIQNTIINKINQLENTKYIGPIHSEEKLELLEWSNIFILPTFYKMEGQPISILEALATQNTIITTNHSGIPDIITPEENGFIVDVKSSRSITEKLIYLKNDPSILEIIGKKNKEYFLKNFTKSKFELEIKKIINANSTIK
jgi:glycosyltransferase involved in cell wall biosynthesis